MTHPHPLPEPAHRGPDGTGSYFDAFTAEQMHTHAAQAVAAERAELEQLRAYADALNARCVADTADAERYRWLKSRKGLTLRSEAMEWTRMDGTAFVTTHSLAADGTHYAPAESLDALIDAAMAGSAA